MPTQKTRATLLVQQTELSTEIDRYHAKNRRLRPNLVSVIPDRTGLIKLLGDSNPIF